MELSNLQVVIAEPPFGHYHVNFYLSENADIKVQGRCLNKKCYIKDSCKTSLLPKIVSEYDQEIPQSQTADNPVAP